MLSHRNRLSLVTFLPSLRERSLGEDAWLPEGGGVFFLWPGRRLQPSAAGGEPPAAMALAPWRPWRPERGCVVVFGCENAKRRLEDLSPAPARAPEPFLKRKETSRGRGAEAGVLSLRSLSASCSIRSLRGAEPRPRVLGALPGPGRSQGGGRRRRGFRGFRSARLRCARVERRTSRSLSFLREAAASRGPFSPSAGAPPPPRLQTASGPVGLGLEVSCWPRGFFPARCYQERAPARASELSWGGAPFVFRGSQLTGGRETWRIYLNAGARHDQYGSLRSSLASAWTLTPEAGSGSLPDLCRCFSTLTSHASASKVSGCSAPECFEASTGESQDLRLRQRRDFTYGKLARGRVGGRGEPTGSGPTLGR